MEHSLKDFVGLYITHLAVHALLDEQRPLSTSELVSAIGDEATISTRLVRQELRQQEYFVFSQHRWDLRWQQTAAVSPLEGVVEELMHLFGKPISAEQLSLHICAYREQSFSTLERAIEQLLQNRAQTFWAVDEQYYGLRRWLLELTNDEESEIICANFFGEEERIQALVQTAAALELDRSQGLSGMVENLINALNCPLSHKELTLLLWRILGSDGRFSVFEEWLRQLFQENMEQGEYKLEVLSLGYWCTSGLLQKMHETLLQLLKEEEHNIRREEEALPISKILRARSKREPSKLSEGELNEMVAWLGRQEHPMTLTRIARGALELFPGDADYESRLQAIATILETDERFVCVGGHKWWLSDLIPPWVREIPTSLLPRPIAAIPEQIGEEPFDVELEDEGLEPDLLNWVESPIYEDVGEKTSNFAKQRRTKSYAEIPVTHHHLTEGALRIRQMDLPLFASQTPIQYLTLIDTEIGAFSVWANLEIGLMFGLKEWYSAHSVPPGGIIRLERTEREDQLRIKFEGERDRLLYIPSKRLEELLHFASHKTVQESPVVTLMQVLLPQHRGGMHIMQLWAELNILRLTSKRVIASLLSAYPCFRRVERRKGVWTLNEERFGEGIRKDKLRFARVQAMAARFAE